MASQANALGEVWRMIRAMDADFMRFAAAGDAAALVDRFYAEDARLLPPGSPEAHGKPAILDFWKNFMASGVTGVQVETTHVETSGDLAFGVGRWAMTPPGSSEATGKYVVVYRRQPDGWRAVADIFNSDQA